jgi:hypothetical protein
VSCTHGQDTLFACPTFSLLTSAFFPQCNRIPGAPISEIRLYSKSHCIDKYEFYDMQIPFSQHYPLIHRRILGTSICLPHSSLTAYCAVGSCYPSTTLQGASDTDIGLRCQVRDFNLLCIFAELELIFLLCRPRPQCTYFT